MKMRNGFVSNSSSASFIIAKTALSELQIKALLEYSDSIEDNWDGWIIREEEYFIKGRTTMDNGSISDFIDSLEIPEGSISYED